MQPKQRIISAIESFKKGEILVLIDEEDRENEGDLVYASMFSTPQKVNFLATEAKGLICVALENSIASKLKLDPMVRNNTSSYETAFTISVDDVSVSTGISATERNMTIKRLSDPMAKPEHLVRPGHIFPLIAKAGGVLNRTGHTEGAVDLCKISGLFPSAVICEIMKADGEMARRKDLEDFAKKHQLKTLYISDIIEYRVTQESLINIVDNQQTVFFGKAVQQITFKDHFNKNHSAIIFGQLKSYSTVRFHHIKRDVDLLQNKEDLDYLLKTIDYLVKSNGVLIFLDTFTKDNIVREFGIGAQIVKQLGIDKINLIASSNKSYVSMSGFNLELAKTIEL